MGRTKRKTKDFAEVIRARIAADPELARMVEEEAFNANIAQQVYDLRNEAGLTQTQLAELVQTHQSVISRIEDSDYDGHSLGLLKRIAFALNKRLRVDFCANPLPCDASVTTFHQEWSNPLKWHLIIKSVGEEASEEKQIHTESISTYGSRPSFLSEILSLHSTPCAQSVPLICGPNKPPV
jgi:transcriptional regulator with XRE-family HTH domain